MINKELNANIVLEGRHYLAFHDIESRAPVHVLIIPKGYYTDCGNLLSNASTEKILDFNNGIAKVIELMKLEKYGFKLISNAGKFTTAEYPEPQSVMHMHVHILGKSDEE